jgi:hypothetical protein
MPDRSRPSYSVYVRFVLRGCWQIEVMETDQTTSLTTFTCLNPDIIRKLAWVRGTLDTPEKQASLQGAIERERGDVYLMLTGDQHSRLRRSGKEEFDASARGVMSGMRPSTHSVEQTME